MVTACPRFDGLGAVIKTVVVGDQLRRGQLIHRALGVEAACCVGSVDISLCIECHAGQRLTTSLIAAIFHGTEGVNDVVGELATAARTQFKDRAPVGAVVATERGISEHIAVRVNRNSHGTVTVRAGRSGAEAGQQLLRPGTASGRAQLEDAAVGS